MTQEIFVFGLEGGGDSGQKVSQVTHSLKEGGSLGLFLGPFNANLQQIKDRLSTYAFLFSI